ncbi:hypothetical protein V1278_007349 [Bradyrhizobium sp. AZCC 1577]
MEKNVKDLFERYENLFRTALRDQVDMDQVASSYATAFVAASPAGVSVGRNDEHLKQMMQQGFENYRRIGTKDMRLRNVRIARIDEQPLPGARRLDRHLRPWQRTGCFH